MTFASGTQPLINIAATMIPLITAIFRFSIHFPLGSPPLGCYRAPGQKSLLLLFSDHGGGLEASS